MLPLTRRWTVYEALASANLRDVPADIVLDEALKILEARYTKWAFQVQIHNPTPGHVTVGSADFEWAWRLEELCEDGLAVCRIMFQ